MRLPKEEYRQAKSYLTRYNYNKAKRADIRKNIMSITGVNLDGMPKAKYNISDSVANSVIKLQENESLREAEKEYNIVKQALQLVNEDSKEIFKQYYIEGKSKLDIINSGVSERTFERRNKELIYAVHKEIKKWRKIGGILIKKRAIMIMCNRVWKTQKPWLQKISKGKPLLLNLQLLEKQALY